MTNTPEPKPTLLASLGVKPGPRAEPIDENRSTEAPSEPSKAVAPGGRSEDRAKGEEAAQPAPQPSAGIARGTARRVRSTSKADSSVVQATKPLEHDATSTAPPVDVALRAIRDQHRLERSTGSREPLAPFNVDVPIGLLKHIRTLSSDIPYPLRRLAEEALELWLVATDNGRPPRKENQA